MKRIFYAALLCTLTASLAHAQDFLVGEYFTNKVWRVAPDGTKTAFAQPSVPSGIRLCGFSFDGSGNLYAARLQGATANAADANNGMVKISPTGAVTAFGGYVPGLPVDTAVDSAGNVYVSSINNGQIRRYSPTGTDLGVFATVTGSAYHIAFDSGGNLFVAAQTAGQVRRFSASGVDLGLFATLSGASSLAFDASGDVYVGTNGGTIRRYSSTGTDRGQFAATPGASFDGLTFAPSGELFAANYQISNGNVQRFSATGASLGAFSSGIASPVGIRFVPAGAVAVPEASTICLFLLPFVGAIMRRTTARKAIY